MMQRWLMMMYIKVFHIVRLTTHAFASEFLYLYMRELENKQEKQNQYQSKKETTFPRLNETVKEKYT